METSNILEYQKSDQHENLYRSINDAFTLPNSDSDKVSDSNNIAVDSYRVHIRIGTRIGV